MSMFGIYVKDMDDTCREGWIRSVYAKTLKDAQRDSNNTERYGIYFAKSCKGMRIWKTKNGAIEYADTLADDYLASIRNVSGVQGGAAAGKHLRYKIQVFNLETNDLIYTTHAFLTLKIDWQKNKKLRRKTDVFG